MKGPYRLRLLPLQPSSGDEKLFFATRYIPTPGTGCSNCVYHSRRPRALTMLRTVSQGRLVSAPHPDEYSNTTLRTASSISRNRTARLKTFTCVKTTNNSRRGSTTARCSRALRYSHRSSHRVQADDHCPPASDLINA